MFPSLLLFAAPCVVSALSTSLHSTHTTFYSCLQLGKSTLIKMLMGKESPDAGIIQIGETVSMIGVGQDRMEELDPTKTAYEEICGGRDEIELGGNYVNSRAYVSWFGFKSAQQQQLVG